MGLASLMIHDIDVQRALVVKDSAGGSTRSWSTVLSSHPCRIQPLRGWKTDEFMQNSAHVTFRIYFATNPLIENGDRLFMPVSNRTFEVRAFWDTEEIGFMWVADCEEVKY